MPNSLRLPSGGYMRRNDVRRIIQYLFGMQSVSVVGFSNVGKSALLRLLAQADVWVQELGESGRDFVPIYVDCNRMFNVSDQGFYELVLRCLHESPEPVTAIPELQDAYESLVAPVSDFQIPLSFNRGLTAVLLSTKRNIVLLLDEFDEPFARIDSRVLLNLRALKDRYNDQLAYVTATGKPLTDLRQEDHSNEFCELFGRHSWNLAPFTRDDGDRLAQRYMEAYEAPFTSADVDFIWQWAGGHPTMFEGVCRVLDDTVSVLEDRYDDNIDRQEFYLDVAKRLRSDENLTSECRKIWKQCSVSEQSEMMWLVRTDHEADVAILEGLRRRHILFKSEGKYQPFCRLLGDLIQRKVLSSESQSASLWVDVESGEVLVNGDIVETLTNLEYKLMLLLYQNRNKIVDKYQIVTNVWGEGYIDEVDDARIEKLISRLRQKIEPQSGNHHFLTTIRGRGYRLVVE